MSTVPSVVPEPPPGPLTHPRITLLTQVIHHLPGAPGYGPKPLRYARDTIVDEQAYERTVRVGEEWKPLDLGWVGTDYHGAGAVLLVVNCSVPKPQRVPTVEERAENLAKTIIVGIEQNDGSVLELGYGFPDEQVLCIHPLNLPRYRVRCGSGEGRYSIFLVPA